VNYVPQHVAEKQICAFMYKNFIHQKSPYNAKDAMENFQIDTVIKSMQKPMKGKSAINVTCKNF